MVFEQVQTLTNQLANAKIVIDNKETALKDQIKDLSDLKASLCDQSNEL